MNWSCWFTVVLLERVVTASRLFQNSFTILEKTDKGTHTHQIVKPMTKNHWKWRENKTVKHSDAIVSIHHKKWVNYYWIKQCFCCWIFWPNLRKGSTVKIWNIFFNKKCIRINIWKKLFLNISYRTRNYVKITENCVPAY